MRTPIFLINMDRSTERLAHMSKELSNEGVEFVRIPAVDGTAINLNKTQDFDPDWAMQDMGRHLFPGEVGCFLSHKLAAKAFLETDAPYGVVLEDDLTNLAGTFPVVEETAKVLEADHPGWRVVNLAFDYRRLKTKVADFMVGDTCHTLHQSHRFCMTTKALLWSRNGAQEFLDISNRVSLPVDNFIREWLSEQGRGFAFTPPLMSDTPDFFFSTIQPDVEKTLGDANAQRRARKAGFWHKQKRQIRDSWNGFCHKYSLPLVLKVPRKPV